MLNRCYIATKAFKQLILLLVLIIPFSSCGKRKPPLPPVERVVQRAEVNGRQIGDRVDLYWKMPARNVGPGNTLSINRVDVYRLAERLDEPLSLTEAEFAARSTLIGSIPISDSDFGLKEKVFSDKIQILGQAARLRYVVRFVNPAGQKAAFSNFFLIEPAANVAGSPADIRARATQDAVVVEWSAPGVNLDGSVPANIIGYNVYRTTDKPGAKVSLLNPKPVTQTRFEDRAFEFGTQYRYFVRTISLGRNAESVESYSSETAELTPVDVFKPRPPEALTIAASPSVISIFFAFNLEPDVIGYRIYRTTDPSMDKKRWEFVSEDVMEANTFQDKNVVPGVVYYYFAVAVDSAGNVSDPSDVISETAP